MDQLALCGLSRCMSDRRIGVDCKIKYCKNGGIFASREEVC